jgi:PIN domain nuclease of toxin-antitoxin system
VNVLLDTHLVLWWMADHPRLPGRARELIADEDNDVAISVASLWEIALKAAQRSLQADPVEVEQAARSGGFGILAIEARHVRALQSLPVLHGDPFDRMLVAQARAEPRYLITADRALRGYGESVLVV